MYRNIWDWWEEWIDNITSIHIIVVFISLIYLHFFMMQVHLRSTYNSFGSYWTVADHSFDAEWVDGSQSKSKECTLNPESSIDVCFHGYVMSMLCIHLVSLQGCIQMNIYLYITSFKETSTTDIYKLSRRASLYKQACMHHVERRRTLSKKMEDYKFHWKVDVPSAMPTEPTQFDAKEHIPSAMPPKPTKQRFSQRMYPHYQICLSSTTTTCLRTLVW